MSFEKAPEYGGEKVAMWNPTKEWIQNGSIANLISFIFYFSILLAVVLWCIKHMYVKIYKGNTGKQNKVAKPCTPRRRS